MSGDLAAAFNDRFDGLCGTVGESGERSLGDAGRLLKESTVGMGVSTLR